MDRPLTSCAQSSCGQGLRQPANALPHGGDGHRPVAQHDPGGLGWRIGPPVGQRIDADVVGPGRGGERRAVDGPAQTDDRVQTGGGPFDRGARQVLRDRGDERVAPVALPAAGGAHVAVVGPRHDEAGERGLLEDR